jgi:hypothetical protein
MSIHVMIESLTSKVKLIESSIAQAANMVKQWSDNHHGLIGMLQATKEALDDANKLIDSPIGQEVLKEIETIDKVEGAP